MKVEAGKQIYAERKRMNAHPLYKWAKHARAYAAVLRCQLPDKRLSHRPYYELLIRALFDYAERIEAALAANPNLDYAREGKGGYPDELKPSSKLIYERLPRIERGQLYEVASHLGLKRHRTVWGEINRRNP